MTEDERLSALRDEITQMLAAALSTEQLHAAELERRDELTLPKPAVATNSTWTSCTGATTCTPRRWR
jgi:hypothetical protein